MARHVGTDRAGTAQSLSTTGTIVAAIACGGLAIRTQTVKRATSTAVQTSNNCRVREPESRGDATACVNLLASMIRFLAIAELRRATIDPVWCGLRA